MEDQRGRGFDVLPGEEDRKRVLQNPALLRLVESLSGGSNSVETLGAAPTLIPAPVGLGVTIPAPVIADSTTCTLFVGNVKVGSNETVLRDFLNAAMKQVGLANGEDPIYGVRMNNKFAFIDLRTPEDATNALNLTGIPFFGEYLKISRPTKYSGPNTQSKTWAEMIGQEQDMYSHTPDSNTKNYREIFVGNLPMDMQESQPLAEFFNLSLRKLGLASCSGKDPVVNVRMNKKFCFVEFFTVEEAINATNFNGIPFQGTTLTIKSPSNVKRSLRIQFFSWEGMLRRWIDDTLKLIVSGELSNVICLENMLSEAELGNQNIIDEVVQDAREECSRHGKVLGTQLKKISSRIRMFIDMDTPESAKTAICALKGRDFNSRHVNSKFYPSSAYREGKYDMRIADIPICAASSSGHVYTTAAEFMTE